jgi:streptogramin lyase
VELAGGDEGVWVLDRAGGTVIPIEIQGNTAGTPIRVGAQPAAIDVGLDAVWVVDSGDGSLYRVDPGTREVVATPIGPPLASLVVDEATQSVWIAPAPR